MNSKVWLAGVVFLTGTSVWAEGVKSTPKGSGDARAAALMDEAAKSRYTWSPEVSSVSGKVAWSEEGKKGSGTFRSVLHQRGGLVFTGDNATDVPAEVREHVGSLILHRTPPAPGAAPRPAAAYRIVVEDEDRGPLIMTMGDAMFSTQRIKDGKMVQVNRLMGGKRFTIDVTRFEKTQDGHEYPADFTVTWWDASSGKRVEKQAYTTMGFYQEQGQMFPKAEKVVSEKGGKTTVLEINYTDVKFEMAGRKAARR